MSNKHHNPPHHGHGQHGHGHPSIKLGTRGDDVIDGTDRDNFIFSFSGDDTIHAGKGNDHVFAGSGDDFVDGGKGNDDLHGGRGNDAVVGGDGNDDLHGDKGNDLMFGGAGYDELDGGTGNDKFVFRHGSGTDVIKKLEAGDRIDVRDFGFASAQDVIDAFRQVGNKAVLNLGNGDKLIIEHQLVSRLDEAQFIFSDTQTGPSSSQSSYILPVAENISTVALLSVGDQVGFKSDGVTPWKMVGIPDGLGAFDNGDGTFTVLMNHELGATDGVVRDHGFAGSFVSKLVIDKTTLEVTGASDLIKHAFEYNLGTDSWVAQNEAIGRLCSADLPAESAFYNAATGLGYNGGRIFMSGEEAGNEGRAYAHFVNGAEAGNSYEIAAFGNMSYENQVANAHTGNKTVVALTDDSSPLGQVYFYFGDKKATGSALDKAGLTHGTMFGLKVNEWDTLADNNNETSATNLGGDFQSSFSLVNLGDASASTGAALQTQSEANEVTEFLRPEDGQWDTINHDRFYFVTTNGFGLPSRLWAVDFNDASNPNGGGTIKMLLDGTEGQQMLDNMTVTKDGKVLMQEDVGNNAHIGKIWEYDPLTDTLTQLAQHDPDRFLLGGSQFLTQDEESSGIIDITDILGSAGQNAFLMDVQSHNALGGELVQGGQLVLMYQDLV